MSEPAASDAARAGGASGVGAIVLSGGRASRLGYTAKGAIQIGQKTLLARLIEALDGIPTVVVGDDPVPDHMFSTREDPPFSGPAAAIAAGSAYVDTDQVLVLAVDLPFADRAIRALPQAPLTADGVLAIDHGGRRQYLLSRIWHSSLRNAVARRHSWEGQSVRNLFASLTMTPVPMDAQSLLDIDTWDDARRARQWDEQETRKGL